MINRCTPLDLAVRPCFFIAYVIERLKFIPMKKTRLTYPSIVEVSQTEDFIDSPYMKHKRKQICIGKLGRKFVCVQSKEEHIDWMLTQIKHSIKSGAISGLILEYWNYARKI